MGVHEEPPWTAVILFDIANAGEARLDRTRVKLVFGWMFSVHSASGSFFRDPLPLTAGCLDMFFHSCHVHARYTN